MVSEHVGDLGNIFEILKRHKLCLNASKCFFGVGLSKFLGYMSHTMELKSTLIKLKQLTICNLLGILKRSRS